MNSSNQQYMNMALSLAFENIGLTSPNPAVGAVIVRDGMIVSTGATGPCGSAHAEVNAILSAEGLTSGADMYVSLEPCSHHGRTPPCVEAIVRAGISRVFIPILDPNPKVAGRGIGYLRSNGVEVVILREYEKQAADLTRPFKKSILRKLPFVIFKNAVTMDGRTAADSGDSKWITSEASRLIVHRLRGKVDAVIVGKNTFMNDSPMLNVRLESFEPSSIDRISGAQLSGRKNFFFEKLLSKEYKYYSNPLKVIIGLPENIEKGSPFFADSNYLIFENIKKLDKQMSDSFNIVWIDESDPVKMVNSVLRELTSRGIMSVLLEGGASIAGSFLKSGEIDQFLYFIAPKIIGSGITSIKGDHTEKMSDALKLHDVSYSFLGEDIMINGYIEPYSFERM